MTSLLLPQPSLLLFVHLFFFLYPLVLLKQSLLLLLQFSLALNSSLRIEGRRIFSNFLQQGQISSSGRSIYKVTRRHYYLYRAIVHGGRNVPLLIDSFCHHWLACHFTDTPSLRISLCGLTHTKGCSKHYTKLVFVVGKCIEAMRHNQNRRSLFSLLPLFSFSPLPSSLLPLFSDSPHSQVSCILTCRRGEEHIIFTARGPIMSL